MARYNRQFDHEINLKIVKLIESGLGATEIGLRLGVSGNAVRKRYRYQKGLEAGLGPIEAKRYCPSQNLTK